PFDYFHLEVAGVTNPDNFVDRLLVRGLILGSRYDNGDDCHGVWGLYGGYSYLSPGIFRVASTALSLGTTAQVRPSPSIAVRGPALAGVGAGAAGNVADEATSRNYHYGAIPQGVLDLGLSFGETAMLRVAARDYFVIGIDNESNRGDENILQADLSLT